MSEMSEKARSEGKEKVKRLTASGKGAVDASGWTEDEYGCGLMNTQKKLGNRPISKQNLATGGRAAHKHAGRKARDMGGQMQTPMGGGSPLVANVPAPPQNRFSFTGQQSPLLAAAGMNKGGKASRADGGETNFGNMGWSEGYSHGKAGASPKKGGSSDYMSGHQAGRDSPKRAPAEADAANQRRKASAKYGTPTNWGGLKDGGRAARADGGMAEEIEGKRPMGGRMPRASGGSTGKGKMNVNIIIAQKPDHQMMGGGAPGGAMPPPKPPMPMMPPGGPGAPPPMGGPGGAPAGPMPGGPNMPPPSMQPHAKGGSVYPDMKFSAANGKGRLEKAKKYCA